MRPVIGHVNLDPSQMFERDDDVAHLTDVVLHEFVHALGWTPSLAQMRDSRNTFYWSWSHDYTSATPRAATETFYQHQRATHEGSPHYFPSVANTIPDNVVLMGSPHVVREAQRHFGCDAFGTQDLPGLELEDWTFGLSKHTPIRVHWEKRILSGEIMNSMVEKGAKLSSLTLAALHDTGYYIANYHAAESLSYGRGAGCGFVMKACAEWHTDPRAAPYSCLEDFTLRCRGQGVCSKQCSADRTYLATCNAALYRAPLAPQYLHASTYSGARPLFKSVDDARLAYGCDQLMDNCMVWRQESETHTCAVADTASLSGDTNCDTTPCDPFNVRSRRSACFEGTLHMREFDRPNYPSQGHCLPYVCMLEPHSKRWMVNVTIARRSLICTQATAGRKIGPFDTLDTAGGQYATDGGMLRGSVLCPDPEVLCTMQQKPQAHLTLEQQAGFP